MKIISFKRITTLLMCAAMCTALLSGCAFKGKSAAAEEKALAYYKEKYALEDVFVVNSHKAGDYNAPLGYLGVKDLFFEMSDGRCVLWNSESGRLSDNAQAEEILSAFEKEFLETRLSAISCPMKLTDYTLNRTEYDSFDENVFSAYFDGDILAFLKEERPEIGSLSIALQTEDRDACEEEVRAFFDELSEYVGGTGEVYILRDGIESLTGSDWTLSRSNPNVTAFARLYFGDAIYWYRQSYIEIIDGVFVTSDKSGFVFEEGDVRLEQIGSCAQLQQMLDKAYYALPTEAEENKKGGDLKPDQRHETRYVLDDEEAPLYRLVLSRRVLDELDRDNCIRVIFLNRRGDGLPLMKYTGKNSRYAHCVFKSCDDGREDGSFDVINPEYLYYFGTVRYTAND